MDLREQLYNKLSAAYDAYIADLKTKPPDRIVAGAYAAVFKSDILSCFEDGTSLSDKALAALLALENPLDELYSNWLDTDTTHMDDLSESVNNFAKREAGRYAEVGEVGEASAESKMFAAAETASDAEPRNSEQCELINGNVDVGDWVLVKPNETHGCLMDTSKNPFFQKTRLRVYAGLRD